MRRTEENGHPILTRDLLNGDGFARLLAEHCPHLVLLSEEERHASLRAALQARPEHGDGIWLFAYGSLIWNPTIRYRARQLACVAGWHRSFCLETTAGRGTTERPGLLLGLMEGGRCAGAVFRLNEDGLWDELDILWRREMVTRGYIPRWVPVENAAGQPIGQAITFTINPEAATFAGKLPDGMVAHRIATACGPLGTAAEYLFRTRDGLHSMAIEDGYVERIARLVEAELAVNGEPYSPDSSRRRRSSSSL